MKVYYYHMVPIKSYYEDWKAGKIPWTSFIWSDTFISIWC